MNTKPNTQTLAPTKEDGVFLNATEAEEFRLYQKRKRLNEISSALTRSVSTLTGGEDVQRTCERAVRLRQIAVKTPLSKLAQAALYLADGRVRLDCVIGGTGETLTKVKQYETRLALKKAQEITLLITPSHLDACRYNEIRREIKKIVKTAGKAGVKVRVEKSYPSAVLSRLARIACECRARYLSVPFFAGCEKLRLDLTGGCALEVTDVQTLADYRKLTDAGVGRIVTDRAWEIYSEWLRELNAPPFVSPNPAPFLAREKDAQKERDPLPQSENEIERAPHPAIPTPPCAIPDGTAPTPAPNPATIPSRNPAPNPATIPAPNPAPTLATSARATSVSVGAPRATNPETDYRCYVENGILKFH